MKKTLSILSILSLISITQTAFAEIGYVDYAYISKNYPLAVQYNNNLKNKVQSIQNYAKQKDVQVSAAKTKEEKDKIRREGISQVQSQQKELSNLRTKYESELTSKVRSASETIRVQKKLDMIIKADARVTGGVNCTNDVLNLLKAQNTKKR